MKCVMCDNPKDLKDKSVTRRYTESGLDNVWLSGVRCATCDKCGESYFSYGDIEQLHALIARAIVFRVSGLNPEEARFLRTRLGYSGVMFAKKTGYSPETISRFERGKQPLPRSYQIMLKALVAVSFPNRDYVEHEKLLSGGVNKKNKIEIKQTKNAHWELCVA